LVEIGRFFPSSRLCQFCGCINDSLTLADRTWTCDCGAILDRDWNAALNIERQALKMLAGVGSRTTQTDVDGIIRPFGAVLCEASKLAEERRPSIPAVI